VLPGQTMVAGETILADLSGQAAELDNRVQR